MSTVLFLGAGASMDAGYPATLELLDTMDAAFEHPPLSHFCNDVRDWDTFNQYRNQADGFIRAILKSGNPEIVLTLPDLADAAREYGNDVAWSDLRQALSDGDGDMVSVANEWWGSENQQVLNDIATIKAPFQRAVQSFFLHKHGEDSTREAGERREYLRKALTPLKQGDTVITTNWDTLAERTLMEARKWSPSDGYGFPVALETADPLGTSAVEVLKLHGSAGWFRTTGSNEGELYLQHARYLQRIRPSGCQYELRDRKEPRMGHGPSLNPVVIFPSYLKQLDDPKLRIIWGRAAHALYRAGEVTFVGYSLPLADVAIRVLINPLRQKVEEEKVKVTIVNPDPKSSKLWKDFLGDNICCIREKAKAYYC